MKRIYFHELKSNCKSFLLWTLIVGGLGFMSILLFSSMEGSIQELADSFGDMGAFSAAFGMDKLSLATLSGYFASEISTMHGLGGGMFAAAVATIMLSKEEDAHTAEFLYTLPVKRSKTVAAKLLAVVSMIAGFQAVCTILYFIGFKLLDGDIEMKHYILFMCMQLVMNIEIAAICFLISAVNRKNKLGIGLGIALLFYAFDLIGNIVPALSEAKKFGPYSYANGPTIFTDSGVSTLSIIMAAVVICGALIASFTVYTKRDLSC